MHLLHHLSFATNDLPRAGEFYDATLGALGYRRVCDGDWFIGYGVEENRDKFALKRQEEPISVPWEGFHLAFAAPNRASVDAFYAAAMRHGATDNGGCGLHTEYGPNYYAAFVLDPDGYWIEAVINTPV
jgi:catechol 2,3-dioxygenase-like lactoylglutathione lyase family enzyme